MSKVLAKGAHEQPAKGEAEGDVQDKGSVGSATWKLPRVFIRCHLM
jgi:hypothetical protein